VKAERMGHQTRRHSPLWSRLASAEAGRAVVAATNAFSYHGCVANNVMDGDVIKWERPPGPLGLTRDVAASRRASQCEMPAGIEIRAGQADCGRQNGDPSA